MTLDEYPAHTNSQRLSERWAAPILVAIVALLLRLAIIIATPAGHTGDMRGWMETSEYLVDEGVGRAY